MKIYWNLNHKKSSPVAIRTQDLLLRRQLLYPAELRDHRKNFTKIVCFVGIAGFEPATSCSQSRRDNRTTLHPEFLLWRRKGDSNPRYPNRVRQFSKLLVSATHPSLRDQFRVAKVLIFFNMTKYLYTFFRINV